MIWAKSPKKYEAGTPAIVNIIAFARALQLVKKSGMDTFRNSIGKNYTGREFPSTSLLPGLQGIALLDELRKTIIGLGLQVPVAGGKSGFINLDSSATTSTFLPIWETFKDSMYANDSKGEEIVSETQKICSDFLGAPLDDFEIIFTGNTTESINVVANSLEKEDSVDFQPVVVSTIMEHSSNDLPWRMIPGHSMIRIPVDKEGFIDLTKFEELLEDYNVKGTYGNKRVQLVAVSGASNVLGSCNDLKLISTLVHRFKAKLLVDGAQLVAHRRVQLGADGIDYFAFSAHKIYAPFGCGVLVLKKGLINFTPNEREHIRLSGLENIAGIAALGEMLQLLRRIGMDAIEDHERNLTAMALRGMNEIPGMQLVGIKEYDEENLKRRVGVIPFNLKNVVSFRAGKELAFYNGIGVRVGCHCAHIIVKHVLDVSPGLEKFQRFLQKLIPSMSFPGVIRVSLGLENSTEDIEELIKGLEQIQSGKKGKASKYSKKEMKRTLSEFTNERLEKVFGFP